MRVCISFDWDNDKHYRYLLSAISKNSKFELQFEDWTPNQIQSSNISVVKANLTKKIRQSECMLVIIGEYVNKFYYDYEEIGYRNWINFEIAKAKEEYIPIIAVKIEKGFESPEEILGYARNIWVYGFEIAKIEDALAKI